MAALVGRRGRSGAAGPPNRVQAWLLAVRPRTLSAAAAPVVAGSGFAAADGVFGRRAALAALAGAVLIQIATNLANDYYDFVKGGDTAERLGPVRVTQAGILSPAAVRRGMWTAVALAVLTGAYLAWIAGWPVIAIGAVSLLAGLGYTGGPYPLAYHGLGDAAVFAFFGVLATSATYFVQAGQWAAAPLLAGAGIGALSTAMLVVNNLRDRETDEAAGKRTLAVRFGDRFAAAQYVACLAAALAVPVAGVSFAAWSPWTLLSLAGLVHCLPALERVFGFTDRRGLNPALGLTARGVALYGVGLGVGALLGSR